MITKHYIEQYREQGYFIADDAVSPEMLVALREALIRCDQKVRSGAVVDDSKCVRLNGNPIDTLTHIRALLAPEFAEPVFAEYISSDSVRNYIEPILGVELRLGWVSALVTDGEAYHIGWHRDIGNEERDGSYEVEMEILNRVRKHTVKWHVALIDDACTWVVPGSHKRYRTDEERKFLVGGATGELSTGKQIVLREGQTMFWTGNTIHRGLLPEGMTRRLTLTAALARYKPSDPQEQLDTRYEWMLADNVRSTFPEYGKCCYDNWRAAVGK